MERKIAQFIVKRYRLLLILLVVITAFFAYHIPKISIVTNMTDLLSSKHRYVKLDQEFRKVFGGSNLVMVQVLAKDGDIFKSSV